MNPDILQYRKELLTAAPKNRKAKRMLCKEFDLSLQPLLEDIPSPTYQDLMDAFGSPSHMAQTLLDSIHIPPPLSCKQKLGIALGIVCTILCIIFLIFYSFNRPENDLSFGDVSDYPLSRLCDEFVFCGTETFNDNDTDWTQPRGYHHYLVLLIDFRVIEASTCSLLENKSAPDNSSIQAGDVFSVSDSVAQTMQAVDNAHRTRMKLSSRFIQNSPFSLQIV